MQKVGAKSGAVFPQAVVQVARSKIWDTKIAIWGRCRVGAGRCPILATNCLPVLPNSPQEQIGAKCKKSRCKIRCGRHIQFVPRFGATASRMANLRENVAVKKRLAATSCENGSLPSAEPLRTAFLFTTAHFRAHGSFQPACRAMNVKGIWLKRPLMARLTYSINF
jgi:hypothetical protein